ncbi:MAG: hypothetical protein KDA89_16050, partial [Planctomycetaceae bacterium]|nr:hypothetical protein [Planctomycetaceae bacterium]
GPVLGTHRVEIEATRETGRTEPNRQIPGEEIPVVEQYLPEKYNASSQLTVTIRSGSNEASFDLH